jgi:hypothetical protein
MNATHSLTDDRRRLVDLLPQFLKRRRSGFGRGGLQALLEESRLTRPAFFLLRAIVEETDPGVGMTETELRANLFNPYATVNAALDLLPTLVEQGKLTQDGERYIVTVAGRDPIERSERGAHAYLATLEPIPADDLTRLADTLRAIAERMWSAPEPAIKAHQARVCRLVPVSTNAAMVRLDVAVYTLWTARDDAHMAAWRAAGFDGPTVDLLSRLWSHGRHTLADLTEVMRPSQRPQDIEAGVEALISAGYVARDRDVLQLTPQGRVTRDWIEAETNRMYFAPWPPLTLNEVAWLRGALQTVCERLP